jgi:hypothetical protein
LRIAPASDVMSRKSVMATGTTLLSATKNHMLAIPSRCGHLLVGLTNFQQAHDVLDTYIRLGLGELSEFDVEQYIALSRGNLKETAAETRNGENESAETL